MKYYFLILLFWCAGAAAQNFDMEKDTIQMKEMVVTKKGKKLRLKTLMLKGPCYSPEPLRDAAEIVTLIENIPAGHLETISFYFNGVYAGKEAPGKNEEAAFGLLIYTVDKDNTPGERIAYDPKAVSVSRQSAGKLTIDVSGLDLESRDKLFIGLVRESGPATNNSLFLDCLCNGHDKYMTLARTGEDAAWERRWVCAAIRVDVGVVVEK